MQYAKLGSSDLRVSRLCLGALQFGWTSDEAQSFETLDAYVAAGGNFLDTADIYSRWVRGHKGGESESLLGRWMAARGNRRGLVVATKVRGPMWRGAGGEGLSRAHIMRAAEGSLKRLQVETIDLYQCHWPDTGTPIEETLRAFEDLVQAGKVRYLGASNYSVPQLTEALEVSGQAVLPAFVSLQPHHSLVHRGEFEGGLQQLCLERGLGVIPYSPLGTGFLTGKYRRDGPKVDSARLYRVKDYMKPAGWAVLDALRDVASARGVPPAAAALAWSLAQPGIVSTIVGANSPSQQADQLPALDLELTEDELGSLSTASAASPAHKG